MKYISEDWNSTIYSIDTEKWGRVNLTDEDTVWVIFGKLMKTIPK